MPQHTMTPDPQRDLVLEREVPVSVDALWRANTEPALLMQWFTPVPWKTIACEIDLRPGGIFSTVMQSPEGEKFPNTGCYLEIAAPHLLVWTGALLPDYRPRTKAETEHVPFIFTARLEFETRPGGALYRATAIHPDTAARDIHDTMGFHKGWGAALDQLVALMKPSSVPRP